MASEHGFDPFRPIGPGSRRAARRGLPSACPTCAATSDPGARYCSSCGTELGPMRPVQGERKFATLLFADVVRSTALAERLDPEDWATIMNGAFSFMNAAVTRYGGTVGRLMGDAVLAYFGAPAAHEDDPERAVRAALDIRDGALEYGREVAARYGVEFTVRVGINSGMAVLATMGDRVKAEYTAMGDTANVAARLQAEAGPGKVLISGDTERLIRGLFELRPRGPLEVKGRRRAVHAFEVMGSLAAPRKRRGVEGLRSPVVGRERERRLLRRQIRELVRGRGSLVAVLGEAGLGKSRMLAELREEVESSPDTVMWLEGRAVSYGETLPYHPWQQVGRQFIGAAEGEAPDVVRRKIRSFAERVGAPAQAIAYYNAMMAVETEADVEVLADAGEELPDRIAEAVVGAVRAAMIAVRATPCVLVFDDIHWADRASVDLIGRLRELTEGDPLLVICVLRPERASPAWAMLDRLEREVEGCVTRVELSPLSGGDSTRMLQNMLPPGTLPDRLRTLILERAEGNPFFLEEVLRGLIDAGHIRAEDGSWKAESDLEAVAIPDTLLGVLAARVDALPEATKRVAQTAAVLGRIFPHRLLEAVSRATPTPGGVDPVEAHLETLLAEGLIRERPAAPEREYIFKHALTQESVYESLLNSRRRELHALTGRVMESLYPQRRDELAPVLAHHYHLGGDAFRAAEHSLRAARRAMDLNAATEAISHYDRAYEDLSGIPDAADRRVDAILGWTHARYKLKQYDGAIERLQEAERLARERQDDDRLARALSWIGTMYMLTGRPSRATPYLVQSSALATEVGDERLMLLPFFYATDELVDRDPIRAARQLDRVIELARRYRVPEIEGHALGVKAVAQARLGEFREAAESIRLALEAAPSGGHRVKEADVHILVGAAYYDMGDPEKGLEHSRIGAELAADNDAVECACAGYYGVGMANLERGEPGEALGDLERSMEFARASEWTGFLNRIRGGIAMAQLANGGAHALEALEGARNAAAADGDDIAMAVLSERIAATYLAEGKAARAESFIDAALAVYRETGVNAYLARALDLYDRIARQLGREDEADTAREEARRIRSRFTRPPDPASEPLPAIAEPGLRA